MIAGIVVLFALLGAVAVQSILSSPPAAEAAAAGSPTAGLSDLARYVEGRAALNLRLVALETLRRTSGSTDQVVAIARGSDLAIAAYACSALGRTGSPDAKQALKDLVTNDTIGVEVRKAAMSAFAAHWRTTGDRDWLEDEVGSHPALGSHFEWLESHVDGK